MAAHNEIGVLQPIPELAQRAHARGAWFHTDAAQAAGKVPIDVARMGVDLLSISGHKLYGPKGIGALYVRRRPRVRLLPLIDGGGQERGLRSGTLPTPLCIGLGRASSLAAAEMEEEAARLRALRDRLLAGLSRRVPDLRINGSMAHRLAGNLNLGFPGVDAVELLAACEGLALSTGSACSSAAVEPSYVLRALGVDEAAARGAVRVALGRFTTAAEIDYAVDALAAAVQGLKSELAGAK
jgi:cysteine desulfurase